MEFLYQDHFDSFDSEEEQGLGWFDSQSDDDLDEAFSIFNDPSLKAQKLKFIKRSNWIDSKFYPIFTLNL